MIHGTFEPMRDDEDRREFLDRKREYIYRLSCSVVDWMRIVNFGMCDIEMIRIGEEWQA